MGKKNARAEPPVRRGEKHQQVEKENDGRKIEVASRNRNKRRERKTRLRIPSGEDKTGKPDHEQGG